MERLNETEEDWVPRVSRLPPGLAWEEVLRISMPLPNDRRWTQSCVLRALKAVHSYPKCKLCIETEPFME